MLKHYVEFDMPGSFFAETEVREVETRVPSDLKNIPRYTYAISFFDREELVVKGEQLVGEDKNHSKRIVFGVVYNMRQLLAEGYSECSPLYRNAMNAGGKAIKCVAGNWQPWDKTWIILPGYIGLRLCGEAL